MEEESPKPADELSGEIDESVAFRLVDEALKAEQVLKQITYSSIAGLP